MTVRFDLPPERGGYKGRSVQMVPSRREKGDGCLYQLSYSTPFLITWRAVILILCIISIFVVGFSYQFTSRTAAIFGLVLSILSAILIGCSIATLFIWDLDCMSFAKRALFVLLFAAVSFISAVLLALAVDPTKFDYYGGYGGRYGGAYEDYRYRGRIAYYNIPEYSTSILLATILMFLAFVLSIADCLLQFYFYRTERVPKVMEKHPEIAIIGQQRLVSRTTEV